MDYGLDNRLLLIDACLQFARVGKTLIYCVARDVSCLGPRKPDGSSIRSIFGRTFRMPNTPKGCFPGLSATFEQR